MRSLSLAGNTAAMSPEGGYIRVGDKRSYFSPCWNWIDDPSFRLIWNR